MACAQEIAKKAPYLVNARDTEGNTPHMLSYKHEVGITCRFLGKNYRIMNKGILQDHYFLLLCRLYQ